MIIIAFMLAILVYSIKYLVKTADFKPSVSVLLPCSSLFLFQIIKTSASDFLNLAKILLCLLAVSIYSLFGFSNHFILSLDIIFFFCSLIILLFGNLKIKNSSVQHAV
jgi:hypothetical protein